MYYSDKVCADVNYTLRHEKIGWQRDSLLAWPLSRVHNNWMQLILHIFWLSAIAWLYLLMFIF